MLQLVVDVVPTAMRASVGAYRFFAGEGAFLAFHITHVSLGLPALSQGSACAGVAGRWHIASIYDSEIQLHTLEGRAACDPKPSVVLPRRRKAERPLLSRTHICRLRSKLIQVNFSRLSHVI